MEGPFIALLTVGVFRFPGSCLPSLAIQAVLGVQAKDHHPCKY